MKRSIATCCALLGAMLSFAPMVDAGAASVRSARTSPGAPKAASELAARVRDETVRAHFYRESYTDIASLIDYVLPISASETLTWAHIEQLTPQEIALARNEILARHGYAFTKPEYQRHFGEMPWYRPSDDFTYDALSRLENENIAFLKDVEAIQEHGVTRYEGDVRVDLNGDGQIDRVRREDVADRNDFIDATELYVNGAHITVTGERIEPQTYILDIDPKDRYKEIVVYDDGPSDDPTMRVFRYDGKRIKRIGEMHSYVESVQFDGKGGLRALERGNVLHHWRRLVPYKLRDGKIRRIEERYTVMNTTAVLEKPLDLYASPKGTKVVYTAEVGEAVLLRRTDDEQAIELLCESGAVGWMRFEGHGDKSYFDGLFDAD